MKTLLSSIRRVCAGALLLPLLPMILTPAAGREVMDRVLAEVNGDIVTLSEAREVAWGSSRSRRLPDTNAPDALMAALEHLIDRRLMVQAAEKMGFELKQEEIDRAVGEVTRAIQSQFPDEETFHNFLKLNGLSAESLRRIIRRRERDEMLIRIALGRRVFVSNEEIEQYRYRLKQEGKETCHYLLDQILLAFPRDATNTERIEKFHRATDIRGRIGGDETFEDLAKLYSDDKASARRGGDMGWVARGDLRKELVTALEKLSPGEISQPVLTKLGYHILRLRQVRDAEAMLFKEKVEAEQKRWIEELRKKAMIRYFPLEKETVAHDDAATSPTTPDDADAE